MAQIDIYLKTAGDKKASDLHLLAGAPPMLRINGELEQIDKEKKLISKDLEGMIAGMLRKEDFDTFRKNKEFDVSYEVAEFRFRVNLSFEKGNMSLVARVIPNQIPSMEDLELEETIQKFIDLPYGLVLFTGPTGSGKSTSLASMIQAINLQRAVNIITLEDPVEFIYNEEKSIIRQRELGRDMLSFAEGLKHALRQDPDVIMVGEMRDLETIAATLTLAETGHLVFATLHTSSTWQTIERIIDVFPPDQQTQVRLQLANTLRGVVAQQLLPAKEKGRVAAREILLNTPAVANLIRENKVTQIKTVLQTSAKEGMITMDQALKNLVKDGRVEKAQAEELMIFKEN